MSTNEISHTTIHIGSSCLGNPGSGAYAANIEQWNKDKLTLSDKVTDTISDMTTSNQAELSAAIESLRYLRDNYTNSLSVPVILISNSNYLINNWNKWLEVWKNNGWKTTSKKEVKNPELWQQLDEASKGLSLKCKREQGHKVNQTNKAAHALAKKELIKLRLTQTR